jgi:hypothetical protein
MPWLQKSSADGERALALQKRAAPVGKNRRRGSILCFLQVAIAPKERSRRLGTIAPRP